MCVCEFSCIHVECMHTCIEKYKPYVSFMLSISSFSFCLFPVYSFDVFVCFDSVAGGEDLQRFRTTNCVYVCKQVLPAECICVLGSFRCAPKVVLFFGFQPTQQVPKSGWIFAKSTTNQKNHKIGLIRYLHIWFRVSHLQVLSCCLKSFKLESCIEDCSQCEKSRAC